MPSIKGLILSKRPIRIIVPSHGLIRQGVFQLLCIPCLFSIFRNAIRLSGKIGADNSAPVFIVFCRKVGTGTVPMMRSGCRFWGFLRLGAFCEWGIHSVSLLGRIFSFVWVLSVGGIWFIYFKRLHSPLVSFCVKLILGKTLAIIIEVGIFCISFRAHPLTAIVVALRFILII